MTEFHLEMKMSEIESTTFVYQGLGFTIEHAFKEIERAKNFPMAMEIEFFSVDTMFTMEKGFYEENKVVFYRWVREPEPSIQPSFEDLKT